MTLQIRVLLQMPASESKFWLALLGRVSWCEAMVGGARGVFFAVSETWKAFCLTVVPHVESAEFMDLGHHQRTMDFIEVFSGKANMTRQLREVSWQQNIEMQIFRVSRFSLPIIFDF